MDITRRALVGTAAALSTLPIARARAQSRPLIRIGVLTDLSGTYRDNTGPTSVICSRLAAEEFNAGAHGFDVEVLQADHQNKPDNASTITRQWFDQGVDVVADVPTSSVALAVAQIAKEKDKIMLNASATSTVLTDQQCSPNTIVWSFDTYMMAVSQGGTVVKQGGNDWFFITADYTFGHTLEEQTSKLVLDAGGKVRGALRYPFPDTTDFSSYLQQAAASGAKVLGLANAGGDTINCVKQAHEFGLNHSMTIVPLLIFITDVHSIGQDIAQGLYCTNSFYWDRTDSTRAFTKRVVAKTGGKVPNMAHASSYSSILHYLKVCAAMGPAEAKKSGRATVARMKATPTDDEAFGPGSIRADGRGVFPSYLWQVKKAAESKSEWDLYKAIATTPASEVLHPLNAKCNFSNV
jgi:branched-chain amino acid transport system substrate-binding protein